jgi:predicted nucleic-acid-binding Zn-ribbon protein
MVLTEEKVQKVKEWLASKGTNDTCPSCGRNFWNVGDIIVAPVLREDGKATLRGSTVPMVQLVCDNCAYVRLYAAVAMDLVS